jgi:hypothetical protein
MIVAAAGRDTAGYEFVSASPVTAEAARRWTP